MNFLQTIIHKITNYDSIITENNNLREKYLSEITANKLLIEQIAISSEEIEELYDKIEQEEFKENPETLIDLYCKEKEYPLKQIAYQNKRSFKEKPITVFLHELIQPNGYEIYNLARKIKTYTVEGVGNYLAGYLTWKDDKQFNAVTKDYYCTPSESIVYKNVDCEDHAYVMASLMPRNLGVAYGFYDDGTNRFGHAFNVEVTNNKLYVIDTVGNKIVKKLYKGCPYTINYIVTQKGTYVIDDSVKFGMEAR